MIAVRSQAARDHPAAPLNSVQLYKSAAEGVGKEDVERVQSTLPLKRCFTET
jgi:hypothetical protein